ncbi:hypothetical protein DFH94DRAFT_482195 [Russula ochroleuca]|jgi:hypothetical protein|uniref:Uncharacterized protein n=1 Tax=Russula ochroleuca TaxID=152965 RepID=A0A9P5JUB4_9AGAM|nr:hypothetical protein DFH94DRAFT_482195 [Russula ochroleuca]
MGTRPRNRVQKLALGSVPDRAPGRGVASRGACTQTRDATNSTRRVYVWVRSRSRPFRIDCMYFTSLRCLRGKDQGKDAQVRARKVDPTRSHLLARLGGLLRHAYEDVQTPQPPSCVPFPLLTTDASASPRSRLAHPVPFPFERAIASLNSSPLPKHPAALYCQFGWSTSVLPRSKPRRLGGEIWMPPGHSPFTQSQPRRQ